MADPMRSTCVWCLKNMNFYIGDFHSFRSGYKRGDVVRILIRSGILFFSECFKQ